jgi:hypothetical protein
MKKILILLLFTSLFVGQPFAKDAHYLIQEMEELRDSLDLDDPARIDLTLRLADLYFDVSIKEGGESDHKLLKKNRMKALTLYEHTLNGTDGVQKAEGMTRLKIEFQMARLLSRLDEFKRAEKHYLNVQAHPKVPKKMKEQASLALAEWYEEDAKYPLAKKYYDQAISLCDVRSSCNYAHYRKGWLYFKDTKLDKAIAEMKASLWATETEIRESSLQDLILFMSNADTKGEKELKYIKGLGDKLNRPELVQLLVEAFYVAGNRRAGSTLLAYINSKTPSLYFETRLLEEFYGFRKWEKVDSLLTDLAKRSSVDIPKKKEHAKEVQKIFRRYLVQVDSEANVAPDLKPFLLRSIDIYLSIYPNDDLRKKLQQGWLKAEDRPKIKIQRLGRWIKEDIGFGFEEKEIRKLRQTRLSLAQKEKNSDVVLEESLAIAEMLKGTKEAEEFSYVAAREHYSRKEYDKALPLFKNLVTKGLANGLKTKWGLLSQNLILDIYNSRDNYRGITEQVALWTAGTKGLDNKEILKENKEMSKLSIDARFALAAKREESQESLQEFYDFCFQGIYPKKSCSNAKVLAVKFKDQVKLISLLEKAKDELALMNEYELMGRYTDAAKLQEKINLKKQGRKAPHELYMKIALLYELDQNFKDRDRILKSLVKKIKREKKIPNELEGAIFLTLDEAGMINPGSLTLPWSLKRKLSLANRFEFEKPNKRTQKIILGQKESQGPLWSRLVLKKFIKPFKTANSIKFYGRYSKYRFKKRTKAIDKFVALSKKYLDGADLETRTYILHMVTRVYSKLVEDILSTPLPEGLDPETMAQVQMQLQGLSAPFDKVREDYQRLLDAQLAEMVVKEGEQVDSTLKEKVVANLEKNPDSYVDLIEVIEPKKNEAIKVADFDGVTELQKVLLKSPTDRVALGKLHNYFQEKSKRRLASYYKGRVEALEESAPAPKAEAGEKK